MQLRQERIRKHQAYDELYRTLKINGFINDSMEYVSLPLPPNYHMVANSKNLTPINDQNKAEIYPFNYSDKLD